MLPLNFLLSQYLYMKFPQRLVDKLRYSPGENIYHFDDIFFRYTPRDYSTSASTRILYILLLFLFCNTVPCFFFLFSFDFVHVRNENSIVLLK